MSSPGETAQVADGSAADDTEYVEFEYRPTTVGSAVVLGGSLAVIVALAPVSFPASLGAGLGATVLVAGLLRGSTTVVTAGAGVMLAALVGAAVTGASTVPMVVAGVGVVVVFDAGRYAVQLGTQVGGEGSTTRAELYHVGVTVLVTVATAVLGTGVFLIGPGQLPGIVLLALLVAAGLFISGLVVLSREG